MHSMQQRVGAQRPATRVCMYPWAHEAHATHEPVAMCAPNCSRVCIP